VTGVRLAIFAAILTWTAIPLCAQVDIVATAQPRTVSVGEMLTYEITVTIRGTTALTAHADPNLPDFNDFETLTTSSRQGLSMGSGGTQSERTYIYTLRAVKPGDFTFSPTTVQVGGKMYRSAKVQVTVTPGAGPSARSPFLTPSSPPNSMSVPSDEKPEYTPQQAVDLKLSAEPKNPYVGQQVGLTFAFYQSENLYGDTRYEPPSAEDCVVKELPAPPTSTEIIEGRQYLVQKRRWALFPTTPGELQIEPVRVVTALTPYTPSGELHTNSVRLQVQPLPQPPSGVLFEGAVGRFTASLTCNHNSVQAGETFTLCLTIRGTGNIHSLGAPIPQVPDWVSIYKSREDRDVEVGYGGVDDAVGGEARFYFLALAKQSGMLNIPALEVTYFDPDRQQYRIAHTDSVTIQIEPGGEIQAAYEQTENQMQNIKLNAPARFAATPFFMTGWFWALQIIPLLVLSLTAFLSHRRRVVMSDPLLARWLQAPRVAQKHLVEARAALRRDDTTAFCASAAHAITDFIAHKFGLQAADISTREALTALLSNGVDEELVYRVRDLLSQCDRGRFAASGTMQSDEMFSETVQVLRLLKSIRPGRR
jgi:hypothetical protein